MTGNLYTQCIGRKHNVQLLLLLLALALLLSCSIST